MEQRDGSFLHICSNICIFFVSLISIQKKYLFDNEESIRIKWKLKVTSLHNKFPETCIVRVMDFVQSGQYPFQLIICSFSNLHIVHGQELAGLFVVEDLQEGEVKIAMVAQCVPIVHILVSLP
ncbi:hypothetical protein T02_15910 [Trichinella nativa]|uniref:Uncharacterized protein n=1 Tax=Trichinella nativa TaxID=6335 RepID=A0A0V1L7N0_9BILA|nr:hypothetical protein T02_15910 [Trichinella nativa]